MWKFWKGCPKGTPICVPRNEKNLINPVSSKPSSDPTSRTWRPIAKSYPEKQIASGSTVHVLYIYHTHTRSDGAEKRPILLFLYVVSLLLDYLHKNTYCEGHFNYRLLYYDKKTHTRSDGAEKRPILLFLYVVSLLLDYLHKNTYCEGHFNYRLLYYDKKIAFEKKLPRSTTGHSWLGLHFIFAGTWHNTERDHFFSNTVHVLVVAPTTHGHEV